MGELVRSGSKYTDEDRRRAVAEYVSCGSLVKVSERLGIPRKTLGDWRQSDWWEALGASLRHEKEEQWQAEFAEIIDLAHKATKDRLENGDTVHTKDGLKKIPVKAKDAATIGAIVYDKLRLSRNLPTSITDNGGGKAAILKLAEQFKQLSESYREKRIKDAEAIHGESVELSE